MEIVVNILIPVIILLAAKFMESNKDKIKDRIAFGIIVIATFILGGYNTCKILDDNKEKAQKGILDNENRIKDSVWRAYVNKQLEDCDSAKNMAKNFYGLEWNSFKKTYESVKPVITHNYNINTLPRYTDAQIDEEIKKVKSYNVKLIYMIMKNGSNGGLIYTQMYDKLTSLGYDISTSIWYDKPNANGIDYIYNNEENALILLLGKF